MISIPSKSDKQLSQLKDAVRILAWQQYKIDNQVKGLEAYEMFAEEWNAHEIQDMDMKGLTKLIKSLEYTTSELLQIRSEYYKQRNQAEGLASIPVSSSQTMSPPAPTDEPAF
ncbi:MAG: hypothetical protein KME19_10970 [Microcoleus vaginatus WJT46-NPBG5]|jgi:hypothetical protein|nr:hypothetical protein [Microcoleus vaginatus WJT46-NPBG5]